MPRVRRSKTSPGSSPRKSAGESPHDANASVEPPDETHPHPHPRAPVDNAASAPESATSGATDTVDVSTASAPAAASSPPSDDDASYVVRSTACRFITMPSATPTDHAECEPSTQCVIGML